MLSFFNERDLLDRFVPVQRSILGTAVKSLKKGGKLIFSTCSVFSVENEATTEFLAREYGLQIRTESYISGTGKGADSMYVSVLTNS